MLFLTAKDAVDDRIHGLTLGADDYVTKPFALEEVITRLRVILRRVQPEEREDESLITYADLTLSDDMHEVTKGGQVVDLSPTEFKLLRYLLINAEVVVSKAKILDAVWEYDFGGDGNVVESYVSYLRRKIDTQEPHLIHTVRGVGYSGCRADGVPVRREAWKIGRRKRAARRPPGRSLAGVFLSHYPLRVTRCWSSRCSPPSG